MIIINVKTNTFETSSVRFDELPGHITFYPFGSVFKTFVELGDIISIGEYEKNYPGEYDGPWNEDEDNNDYSMEGWDQDEMDGSNDQDYDDDDQYAEPFPGDDNLDAVEAELEYYRWLDAQSQCNDNIVISRYSDNPITSLVDERTLTYNDKRAEINEIITALKNAGDMNGAIEVRRGFDAQWEGPRVIGKIDLDSANFGKAMHNHVLNCKPVGHLYNPASETVVTPVHVKYGPTAELYEDDEFGKESFVIPQVRDDEFYANDF